MPITASTPFRSVGDCSLDVWRKTFTESGSPITQVEDCYNSVKGMSALALAMCVKESSCGKTARAKNNAFGILGPDGVPQAFDSWAAGFKAWMARYQDCSYKGGIYCKPDNGMTLEQMIVTYVGGPDCLASNGARCANRETWVPGGDQTRGTINLYIQQTIDRLNQYLTGASTPPTLTFGRVVPPKVGERAIPDRQNWAWDNLGQRTLKGIVWHRMVGTLWGTDGWFRGGGGGAGLTDWGVDNISGEILRWNDYLGRPSAGVSPNRAPWASGPWQGPPGDGVAFVNKYGVNAINRDLSAIEIGGNYNDPIAAAGAQAVIQLSAYLADRARVPWTQFPLNPATGLTFVYWHSEFQNQKPCPGDVVRNATDQWIAAIQEVLRKAQTG